MNASQRAGQLIFAGVAVYAALLFSAGVMAGIWSVVLRPSLSMVARLCLALSLAPLAALYWVRAFRRGEPSLRWVLFAILTLCGIVLIIAGRLAAIPLPDPAKQAQFEETDWWIVPVSYAVGAATLLVASLLVLPQVGEYFRYRSGRARPTKEEGQGGAPSLTS